MPPLWLSLVWWDEQSPPPHVSQALIAPQCSGVSVLWPGATSSSAPVQKLLVAVYQCDHFLSLVYYVVPQPIALGQ